MAYVTNYDMSEINSRGGNIFSEISSILQPIENHRIILLSSDIEKNKIFFLRNCFL